MLNRFFFPCLISLILFSCRGTFNEIGLWGPRPNPGQPSASPILSPILNPAPLPTPSLLEQSATPIPIASTPIPVFTPTPNLIQLSPTPSASHSASKISIEIPGKSDFKNSLGMKFVKIEPGTFMMGSAPLTTYDRDTQHQVILTQGFYIQTTEVTQEQWEAIGLSNSSFFKGDLNLPVEGVSWIEIQEFIKQLNKKGEGLYRLPTEAEWEYSARSGSETSYSCGENKTCVEDIGWYINNANGKSHPVAQKQPNSWGLYDMHGNVFEWVQDWYQFNIHPNDPKTDPKGPLSGSERILKGGSFSSGGESLRLGNTTTKQPGDHGYFSPDFRFDYYGFRLVREL